MKPSLAKTSFFCAVQVMLTLSAFGKIVGAEKWTAAVGLTDPFVTLLTERQILLSAATLELGVVLFLFAANRDIEKASALLWLGLVFVAYRAGLWAVGFRGYCRCVGYWSSWLNLSAAGADRLSLAILAFMLSGAGVVMVHQWIRRRGPQSTG